MPAAATKPTLFRVLDRHDAYIAADSSLVEFERKLDLRDTALLRALWEESSDE